MTNRFRSPQGFTITELLLSIVIISVLAVVGIVSISHVRRQAEAVGCMSNLRQVGAAILAYAGEHRGELPGPSTGGMVASVSEWGMRPANLSNIANYLAPYLGYSSLPYGEVLPLKVLACPASSKVLAKEFPALKESDRQQFIHLATFVVPGKVERGFGYKDGKGTQLKPLRMNQLESPGKSVALVDRDNDLLRLFGSPSVNIPNEAVHGPYRNVLFFDGRVDAIPHGRISARENALEIRW